MFGVPHRRFWQHLLLQVYTGMQLFRNDTRTLICLCERGRLCSARLFWSNRLPTARNAGGAHPAAAIRSFGGGSGIGETSGCWSLFFIFTSRLSSTSVKLDEDVKYDFR